MFRLFLCLTWNRLILTISGVLGLGFMQDIIWWNNIYIIIIIFSTSLFLVSRSWFNMIQPRLLMVISRVTPNFFNFFVSQATVSLWRAASRSSPRSWRCSGSTTSRCTSPFTPWPGACRGTWTSCWLKPMCPMISWRRWMRSMRSYQLMMWASWKESTLRDCFFGVEGWDMETCGWYVVVRLEHDTKPIMMYHGDLYRFFLREMELQESWWEPMTSWIPRPKMTPAVPSMGCQPSRFGNASSVWCWRDPWEPATAGWIIPSSTWTMSLAGDRFCHFFLGGEEAWKCISWNCVHNWLSWRIVPFDFSVFHHWKRYNSQCLSGIHQGENAFWWCETVHGQHQYVPGGWEHIGISGEKGVLLNSNHRDEPRLIVRTCWNSQNCEKLPDLPYNLEVTETTQSFLKTFWGCHKPS